LRERREDILPLAHQFLADFTQAGPSFPPPSAPAWSAIPGRATCASCATPWSARLFFPAGTHPARASAHPHPPGARFAPKVDEAEAQHLEEIEYQAVLATLRKLDYNRTATARTLASAAAP